MFFSFPYQNILFVPPISVWAATFQLWISDARGMQNKTWFLMILPTPQKYPGRAAHHKRTGMDLSLVFPRLCAHSNDHSKRLR